MHRFCVSYQHKDGFRQLGYFYGSLGSVRNDVYRDYPQIPMDAFRFERLDGAK